MTEINDQVGEEIVTMIKQEEEFYLSSDRDQLKTPPFVYVKRIERPGVEQPTKSKPITQKKENTNRKQRSKSKDKKGENNEALGIHI